MKAITLLSFLLTGITQARLGDTRTELELRYGEPVKVTDTTITYEKNGGQINVVMWKERCHYIMFHPERKRRVQMDGITIKVAGDFKEQEILHLLSNNPKGAKWLEEKTSGGSLRKFTTADKKFEANASNNHVMIQTVAFKNRNKEPAEVK